MFLRYQLPLFTRVSIRLSTAFVSRLAYDDEVYLLLYRLGVQGRVYNGVVYLLVYHLRVQARIYDEGFLTAYHRDVYTHDYHDIFLLV